MPPPKLVWPNIARMLFKKQKGRRGKTIPDVLKSETD
jgi:hypothetical protein